MKRNKEKREEDTHSYITRLLAKEKKNHTEDGRF
jgi:hypothetical protein